MSESREDPVCYLAMLAEKAAGSTLDALQAIEIRICFEGSVGQVIAMTDAEYLITDSRIQILGGIGPGSFYAQYSILPQHQLNSNRTWDKPGGPGNLRDRMAGGTSCQEHPLHSFKSHHHFVEELTSEEESFGCLAISARRTSRRIVSSIERKEEVLWGLVTCSIIGRNHRKQGVVPLSPAPAPPSSQDQSSEAYPYRNSPDVSMKQVHFDHKLFATARIPKRSTLPKRSTIVESPGGIYGPKKPLNLMSLTIIITRTTTTMKNKRSLPRLNSIGAGDHQWLKKGSTLCASWATSRVLSLVDDVISAMRQMGNIRRLGQLTEAIERDPLSVDLSQDDAVHLAALRKKSLRELPEPLTTYKLWVGAQAVKNDDKRKRPLHVISIIMPKAHRDTMEILFVFLKWVASFVHLDEDEYPLIATPYGSRRKLQDNWSGDNLAGKIEKHSSPYQYHTTRNKGLNGRSPTPGDLVEGGRGGGIPSGKKGRTD
ncbi:hypothetical protein FB446DRAFT_708028 [Lentinula raphanica]|nr:hypothetical protein FB446DRAFT_708028 [Lentinula raphanica]